VIAKVNGIELGYEVFGEGRPLILLHGGFGSLEMFGPNIELLAAGRRVVGVDLQSHGRSPAADRPMRFESMADDIAALVSELGLERAAVMGFSLGGGVALRTALQHPEVVERLVLVSTVFKRRGWHPEMTAGMDAMGPETAAQMMATPLYDAYKQVAPRVEDWPVLVGQITEASSSTTTGRPRSPAWRCRPCWWSATPTAYRPPTRSSSSTCSAAACATPAGTAPG
jgi:pimeloyl-ACP methyl ester carboxylesterase